MTITPVQSEDVRIDTVTEQRQVARVLTFEADAVPYINWQKIGEMRADLASDLHVVTDSLDRLIVTLSWHYDDNERDA